MPDRSTTGQQPGVTRRALGAGLAAIGAGIAGRGLAQTPPVRDQAERARVRALLPALEERVAEGLAEWRVPGAAVGVVVDDEVVLARGFGVRDLTRGEPVDENTVFGIGSTTKAFTAAAEAIMVDRGKMGWSDRVLDHDPDFRLFDPWVTREFQIADLLAQRSGLRPYVLDLMWVLGFAPEDVVAALRHCPPVSSFRSTFAYQNVLHAVAGRIVARQAGVPDWGEAVRALILDPLGMSSSSTVARGLLQSANHASGHTVLDGKLQPFEPTPTFDAVGPAGAMNASVTDMLKWLRLQTGRGSFEGRRIVSEENLTETWRPRVPMLGTAGFPTSWLAYASGWIYQATPNGPCIWHNGGTGLIKAHVGFVPARRVGFVMLTNEGANALQDATGLWFYDRVLGNPEVDYSTEYRAKIGAASVKARAANRRPDAPAPAGPAADYTGAYRSPALKAARVEAVGTSLRLTFEATRIPFILSPWSGDAFVLSSEDKRIAASLAGDEPSYAQFQRDPSGRVSALRFVDSDELTLTRSA